MDMGCGHPYHRRPCCPCRRRVDVQLRTCLVGLLRVNAVICPKRLLDILATQRLGSRPLVGDASDSRCGLGVTGRFKGVHRCVCSSLDCLRPLSLPRVAVNQERAPEIADRPPASPTGPPAWQSALDNESNLPGHEVEGKQISVRQDVPRVERGHQPD